MCVRRVIDETRRHHGYSDTALFARRGSADDSRALPSWKCELAGVFVDEYSACGRAIPHPGALEEENHSKGRPPKRLSNRPGNPGANARDLKAPQGFQKVYILKLPVDAFQKSVSD